MRLICAIFCLSTLAAAEEPSAKIKLLAAVECMDLPPSVNPWGRQCVSEVAKRWAACDFHRGRPSAFYECLGFQRPPPLTWLQAFKGKMLRRWAVNECSSLKPPYNEMGADCPSLVADRFEFCGPPAVRQEITSEALLTCLGFAMPSRSP